MGSLLPWKMQLLKHILLVSQSCSSSVPDTATQSALEKVKEFTSLYSSFPGKDINSVPHIADKDKDRARMCCSSRPRSKRACAQSPDADTKYPSPAGPTDKSQGQGRRQRRGKQNQGPKLFSGSGKAGRTNSELTAVQY